MARNGLFAFTSLLIPLLGLFSASCGDQSGNADESCLPGREGCPCDMGVCLAGLSCLSDLCVNDSAGSSETLDTTDGDSTESSTTDPSSTTMDPSGSDTSDETATTTSDMCADGELLCDGVCVDPQSNDDHCGSCGFGCMIGGNPGNGELGGCLNGECKPFWSGCTPPENPYDCNQVCFDLNAFCAPSACGNVTMVYFDAGDTCDDFNIAGSYSLGCIQPENFGPPGWYRCCCQQ